MNYEAFFFDFDGVLADSVEVKTKAFAHLYQPYGPEIVAKVVAHHRQNGGLTRAEKFKYYHNVFLKQPINDSDLKSLCDKFSRLVVDEVIRSKETPGAKAFLSKWAKKVSCFLISATPDKEIEEIIKRRGLSVFFKEIAGSSLSKEENLKRILAKFSLNPSRCLFFGDAESDYIAAAHCRVPFVGILPNAEAPLLNKYPSVFWRSNFYDIDITLTSMPYSQQGKRFKRPLIILDNKINLPQASGVVAYWNSFEAPKTEYSIPRLVDDHAEEIKKEYLAFVYELGKCKIKDKTLEERLLIRKSFSFWWLTLMAEKHFQRSPKVYDVFRLRIIEQLFYKEKCDGVILYSENQLLHKTLQLWCKKINVFYYSQSTGINLSLKIPRGIKAIVNLFRLIHSKRHLIFTKRNEVYKRKLSKEGITIVTYFPNMDTEKAKDGYFRSSYWNGLHDLFEKNKSFINWVFIFSPDNNCRTPKEARMFCEKFSKHHANQTFSFIEQWFSWRVLFQALRLFFLISLRAPSLSAVKSSFVLPNSQMPIYLFLEQDWKDSFYGWQSMSSCLYFVLYEKMAEETTCQNICLYLLENNAWERGLIYAWKTRSQAPIIGYQHSAIRELDMRFFADARTYHDNSITSMPLPTLMAVNGQGAYQLMIKWGYPQKLMVEVEALRYFYVNKLSLARKEEESKKKILLVVTDIVPESNIFLLKLLVSAFLKHLSSMQISILIKPHPYFSIDKLLIRYAPNLEAEITNQPLNELFSKVDWVLSANNTTCGLEAVILGLPVIIAYDPNSLNINPLRGFAGVKFISNVQEFMDTLESKGKVDIIKDYFYLDESLTKWKTLLFDSMPCS